MVSTVLVAIAVLSGPRAELDVAYSRAGGEELKMDVYFPAGESSTPRSAVVVVHGGAWMSGKRQDMAQMAQGLAEAGFVAATVSYRLAPKHRWPAMLDDVQTAVRFVRSKASAWNVNPKAIGSAGASAGGHLSLLLGFRETRDPKPAEYAGLSSKTQAVFNLFGPTDFRRDFAPSIDSLVEIVLGKKKAEAAEDIRLACPVEWIDAQSAPVFTVQGDADPLVPFAQAKWLKECLDKKGVKNELRIVPKMAHGVDPASAEQMKAISEAVAFLKSHLK